MKITEKSIPNINEKYKRIDLDNGFTVFIINKQSAVFYGSVAVNFGAADTKLLDSEIEFPVGTAHFLEHKMFETKQGDSFNLYAKYGGDANAYTSGDKTVYLFSCTENFYENLGILLDHVFNASFTEKSVKKEKGIISQEINMYEDNPRWRGHRDLLEIMYGKCSISADPCGTPEYIKNADIDSLNKCRDIAYRPSNMVLCVCGNIEENDLIKFVNERVGSIEKRDRVRFALPDISNHIIKQKHIEYGDVYTPLFYIGVRFDNILDTADIKSFAAIEILMDLLLTRSSDLYSELYDAGLFEEIDVHFQTVRNAYYAVISGVSKDPDRLYEELLSSFERISEKGFSKEDFVRTKKSLYADLVYSFATPETLADAVLSYSLEDDDFFEYPSVVAGIDKAYAEEIFKKAFKRENTCISVIYPKEAKK